MKKNNKNKPCKIKKGYMACEKPNKQTILILTLGIILVGIAFVSEVYFHFVQQFNIDIIPEDIFWKFEPVEALNSTTLLIIGGFMIFTASYIHWKHMKKKYSYKKPKK